MAKVFDEGFTYTSYSTIPKFYSRFGGQILLLSRPTVRTVTIRVQSYIFQTTDTAAVSERTPSKDTASD